MKNLPFILLSMALSFLATQVSAEVVPDDGCFILSGTKSDTNGFLTRVRSAEVNKSKFTFAGYHCTILNSFPEIKTHLSLIRLPKDTPIIVVLEAHGGMGGMAFLNGGPVESRSIVKEVRELSETYKVAFFNHSCFSGDVLVEKLNWDQQNKDSKSIDRSCVWSHSLPGRVALGIPEPKGFLDRDYTLEESYAQGPLGVLSSAAWSEVGFVEYSKSVAPVYGWKLDTREVSDSLYERAARVLKGISDMILENRDAVGAKSLIDNALFVLDPATDYNSLKTLMKGTAIKIDSEKIRQAIFFAPPTTDTCTLGVRKFLISQWYTTFSMTMDAAKVLSDFQSNLHTMLLPKNFAELGACKNLGMGNNSLQTWANWLKDFSPIGEVLESYVGQDGQLSDVLDETEFGRGMSSRKLTMDEIFLKGAVLQSITGRRVLGEESKTVQLPGTSFPLAHGYPHLGTAGATGNVLPAFTLASLKAPRLDNELDQRRRNACRGIELKARRVR